MQYPKDTERDSLVDNDDNKDRSDSKKFNYVQKTQEPPATKTLNQSTSSLSRQLRGYKKKKYIKWGLIGGGILIVLILVIVLPICLIKKDNNPDTPTPPSPPPYNPPFKPGNKVNPFSGNSGSIAISSDSVAGTLIYNDTSSVVGQLQAAKTKQQLNQFLQDDPKKLGIDWKALPFGDNNKFSQALNFSFEMLDYKRARLSLIDANNSRFSIPSKTVPKPDTNLNMHLDMVGFNFSADPFSFQFHDVTDPSKVFIDTTNQTLVFSDKYLQIDFLLSSQRIHGLGERLHSFNVGEGTWTMWASGQDNVADDGRGRKGLYGVHPFVMVQTQRVGEYYGMFFRNAEAQSPIITYTNDSKAILSYITIGGELEIYFFIHGTAKQIIQQYHKMIGNPNLPPFWSLGWQEASYNDSTQVTIEATIANYSTNGLPLEAIYLDMNSLNTKVDFSLNTDSITNLTALVGNLTEKDQKLVAYLDSGISVEDPTSNTYYTKGQGLFIKTQHSTGQDGNLVNLKHQKKVVYLDWFNSASSDYWSTCLSDYYQLVNFDGLWTTMNEPYGQLDGELVSTATTKDSRRRLQTVGDFDQSWFYSFTDQSENSTYNLPFIPQFTTERNFDNQTLSLNATHSDGTTEYDLHSLYGHSMVQVTNDFLNNQTTFNKSDNRQFLLTRSTFASTGRYASYALTNNWHDWASLKQSIVSLMNMNMFGIPHTGADVCGFYTNVIDQELCLRWIQLATFYPLARHNQNFTYFESTDINRTHPYLLSNYTAQVKASMHDRMQYLRMMYTCLFESSIGQGSCIEPVYFTYPTTLNDSIDYDSTFMVQGAVKVSPIVEKLADGQTTFQSYFPSGKWLNLANFNEVIEGKDDNATLQVQSTVNAHLAAGSLIAFQNNSEQTAMTTTDLLKKPIALIAHRDDNSFATGTLFLDQGISRSEISNNEYEYYTINAQANSIQFQLSKGTRGSQSHTLDKIMIANAGDLSTTDFVCYYDYSLQVHSTLTTQYFADNKTLYIMPQEGVASSIQFNQIMNIYYGTKGKDLNLCDNSTFQYTIEDGKVPNLTEATNVTMMLTHQLLPKIQVNVSFFDVGIINVKWSWALDAQGNVPTGKIVPFEIPSELLNTTHRDVKYSGETLDKYIVITNSPFSIVAKERINGTSCTYFSINGMVFDSYLNWINVQVTTMETGDKFKGIFGLGQRNTGDFFYKDGVYSMWAHDIDSPVDDGQLPGKNLYGVHPFFMYRHAPESFVGVFYKLAHAQDWWIKNNATDGTINITTVATGGVADIYILTSAQKPETIMSKYYQLVGAPVMIPQWALGWHQCKWCYRDVATLRTVVEKYQEFNIPLDAQWVDIDYMKDYRDFTYDSEGNFADLKFFVEDYLHHNRSMKFVPILDAGIAARPGQNYDAYNDGINTDVFLKLNGSNFIGEVWPKEAVFPDFSKYETEFWWKRQLETFNTNIKFDGLWQDMNEVSNFCNGVCKFYQKVAKPVKQSLLYTPTGADLETKSLPLDIVNNRNDSQMATHSLYGLQQVKATSLWFQSMSKRELIISRSTFAGIGKYGSMWLGDNHATNEHMANSVIGVMMMGIFGIPFSGADICGHMGEVTPELCAKWHQVGAFQPFSRNHKTCNDPNQEPYLFQQIYNETTNQTYTDLMRTAIYSKYHLIRYYYSELHQIHARPEKVFYKPMFFAFPEDSQTYENFTNNVMLGESLKLSINADNITRNESYFYFPQGTWCNIFDPVNEHCFQSQGESLLKRTYIEDFYVHLREGFIIPMQNATQLQTLTTSDLQWEPVDLHILGKPNTQVQNQTSWRAQGLYVNDNGITVFYDSYVNMYDIVAKYLFRNNTDNSTDEYLEVGIQMVHEASIHFYDVPDCSAVNKNDFLNSLYIYNAGSFKQFDTFNATVLYTNNTVANVGNATYDNSTDRLVFTAQEPICLSTVLKFIFDKPKEDPPTPSQ